MISKKYQHYVFGLMMAFLMSGIMSMIISLQNIGLVDDLLLIWLNAWVFAFITAFPVALLVTPTVNNLVKLVVKEAL